MEKELKYIKYVFTEEEKKEVASELARLLSERDSLEAKKKEVASQMKADIETLTGKISGLSRDYNQGYRFKNHPCLIEKDHADKTVKVYREDNHELVEERTMTQQEASELPFDMGKEFEKEAAEAGENLERVQ